MTKTVKELADELGVSRQYVQKIISKLPATKKPKKVQHSYRIDNREESYIKDFMGKIDNSKATYDNSSYQFGSSQETNKYEKALLSEIESLRGQIKQKDLHLNNMQKLLDQSQQLQLMAENKIKQLENKMTDEQAKDESTEEAEKSIDVDPPTKKSERGFWSRLFNKK